METNKTDNQPEVQVLTPVEEANVVATKTTNKPATIIHLDNTGKVDLSKCTPALIDKCKSLSSQIKPEDANSILNFGLDLQNKLAGYSDSFLQNIRGFDAGEVGSSITDLLAELNYVDVDPAEAGLMKKFLMGIPFLKNIVMNTKKIFQKYDSISGNIDGIVKKLDKGRLMILRDNAGLQNLFDQNLQFIVQLEELIIAGQMKYNEEQAILMDMEANADKYEDYQIADKREFLSRLDKRLADMKVTRIITIQSLPQIRLVQNNNTTMAEKIQSTVTTTIPVWKNQISIAVTLMRQKGMVEVQKKVYETTNTILVKNAELLKQNSIDVAKQNEQSIVSAESLRTVNQKLIETLSEVKRIKEEGEATRLTVSKELETLEKELKDNVKSLK